jgi:hypothetical protein
MHNRPHRRWVNEVHCLTSSRGSHKTVTQHLSLSLNMWKRQTGRLTVPGTYLKVRTCGTSQEAVSFTHLSYSALQLCNDCHQISHCTAKCIDWNAQLIERSWVLLEKVVTPPPPMSYETQTFVFKRHMASRNAILSHLKQSMSFQPTCFRFIPNITSYFSRSILIISFYSRVVSQVILPS